MGHYDGVYDILKRSAKKLGYEVVEAPISYSFGYIHEAEHKIIISSNLSEQEKAQVLSKILKPIRGEDK
ncbi:MAG TPA: hypothetical protein VE439_09730 [Anaerolineae bacterium]|jgi:hypothetical protein|nr:hypothetical protein [Anaerolineae bacterium]